MDDMNNCMIIGRLTRDVEVKTLASGQVGNLTIAINREIRRQDRDPEQRTTYVDAVLWGIPDKLAKYLTKGRQIAIRGDIATSSWERDGQQHHKTYITIRDLQLLSEPRKETRQESPQQARKSAQPQRSSYQSKYQGPGPEEFDDDIPF